MLRLERGHGSSSFAERVDDGREVALDGALPMGKFDRRNSQKMKRRKAQVKKKARLKRVRTASAKPATAPKKAAAKKSGPPKAAQA